MVKRSQKAQKRQGEVLDFVVVTFAEEMEQAKEYETLLKSNEIPVAIKSQRANSEGNRDIAVMVPETFLDEAHVIIESQDAYDDFYDFASEDDSDIDFDGDVFEDDF